MTVPFEFSTSLMMPDVPVFSDEQLLQICEAADGIVCECPAYLVGLLRQVRKFRYYTTTCPQQVPEEVETHEWLAQEVLKVEALLSEIIFQFMQREELLDENFELDMSRLIQRSYQASLRQQEFLT